MPVTQPVSAAWGEAAETSPLDVVVFSKDRAAQLDALLRSVRAFLTFPHRLHVVYTSSAPEFDNGYQLLQAWHDGIGLNWLPDKGMFESVARNLVREINQGPGRYLMFLVDDLLFTRPFTAQPLLELLDTDEKILAVSLRLGKNVTYSYLHDQPFQLPHFSQGCRWAWNSGAQGDWSYPMSLDGNIYRTSDIAELLTELNFNSPNEFESAMAGKPVTRPDLVCELLSSMVNIAVNRVQSSFPNRCGNQDAQALNKAFLKGRAVDIRPLAGRTFNSCHIEEKLTLVADERSPEVIGWQRFQRDGRDYLRIDLRKIPTFILNCPEHTQKRMMVEEQLEELNLNYEFVRTMRIEPGWVGVALGHLKVLHLPHARPPFLVLEDDCVFNENFQPVIEVPAEADCLYLSTSLFGLEQPGDVSYGKFNHVFWSRHAAGYLRVYNMLARHALLYLKADFQQAVIECQVEALANRAQAYPCDVGVAMLQLDRISLLTEHSVCRQVNRNATGGSLAELLPEKEWIDGKPANNHRQPPSLQNQKVRKSKPSGLISHKYRFIYFPLSKNASSTLKAELTKPRYATEPFTLDTLDEEILRDYFKFTFLRDPVSRLASAYQEISLRHELEDSTLSLKPFMQMEEGPARFEAFLDETAENKWDHRLFNQCSLLGDVTMDFYGRVESLDKDLQSVFDRLGLGRCPELPRLKSRSSRKNRFSYNHFNIDHQQLTAQQIGRIRHIYRDDVELLQSRCPAPPLQAGYSPSSQRRALEILETENPAPIELFARVNEQHNECLLYVFGNRGFFSELSTVVQTMIYCWTQGYRFLMDSADSRWACKLGWADYFEPFSSGSAEVAATSIAGRFDFFCQDHLETRKRILNFRPEEISFGQYQISGFHNIMAFFTRMVFRPTKECQQKIERLTVSLDLTEPFQAIHIRRGDKVDDEDISYPAETYLQRLGEIASDQCLFVMSDDWSAVEEVRECLEDSGKSVRVASLVEKHSAGFDVEKLCSGEPYMGQAPESADSESLREYTGNQVITLLAETLLAARSSRFISTWRSNVGRTIWYLHNNQQQCILLNPSDVGEQEPADASPDSARQKAQTSPTGEAVKGTLHLRGGAVHDFEVPAGSATHEALRGLMSGGKHARNGKLFQVPLRAGRAVLTFSGSDLRFLSMRSVSAEIVHHPLTHTEEGHLGGYLRSRHPRAAEFGTQHGDPATYTPKLWQWTIDTLGVRSVLDVGCGEGYAAAFFLSRGCAVLGVDGSIQAERDSVIPGKHQRHDYDLGPFAPMGDWDLVWSCEFVEHVEERYSGNFLASFDCARKYVMMTYAPPGQLGWHHVNCQPEAYWVKKMKDLGFRLDQELTHQAREVAEPGHFKVRGLVFVRAN
jgi:hypothetical protein